MIWSKVDHTAEGVRLVLSEQHGPDVDLLMSATSADELGRALTVGRSVSVHAKTVDAERAVISIREGRGPGRNRRRKRDEIFPRATGHDRRSTASGPAVRTWPLIALEQCSALPRPIKATLPWGAFRAGVSGVSGIWWSAWGC